MPKEPVAVFTRDGQSREAYTPGEAVALRADGWLEAPVSAVAGPAPAAELTAEPGTSLDLDDTDPDGDVQ